VLAVATSFLASTRSRGHILTPLHLAAVSLVGMTCHRRLAEDRPHARRLTEFYLLIATGGVLGGAFVALVAPALFRSFAEYPITLALACFLRPPERWAEPASRTTRALDVLLPLGLAMLMLVVVNLVTPPGLEGSWSEISIRAIGPAILTLPLLMRRTRFALGISVLLVAVWFLANAPTASLYRERTFFGVQRVVTTTGPSFTLVDDTGRKFSRQVSFHVLIHGTIRHGTQALDADLRDVPTTYYHRTGPIGQVMATFVEPHPSARVAIVGLGAGTLAAYGRTGQTFTYFELDPAIARIASDTRFFTYLADSKAKVDIVTGDGRLTLAARRDGEFDLVVLDAFSSDAIPVHLLTREALALDLRKLSPHGLLAIHITNGYLRLDRVVAAVAADLGLACRIRKDGIDSPTEAFQGKDASTWAVLARERSDLGPLESDTRWVEPVPDERFLWTDQSSSILGIMSRM